MNPTPIEARGDTEHRGRGRRSEPDVPVTILPAPEPEFAPAPTPPVERKPVRYRVLKAITLSDGRTAMPGEVIDVGGSEWPSRRPKQLTDLGFLRPIEE